MLMFGKKKTDAQKALEERGKDIHRGSGETITYKDDYFASRWNCTFS